MRQRGEREKAPRTEGVNQRRKRLLQNKPKARAGRAAERPSGMGGLGRPAGQGRWGGGVVAGPADMGRVEVADFLRSTHS
jgi:hypothetical protein